VRLAVWSEANSWYSTEASLQCPYVASGAEGEVSRLCHGGAVRDRARTNCSSPLRTTSGVAERHQLQDPFPFLIYAELAGVELEPCGRRNVAQYGREQE
jgi:hypothetical protein